MSPVTPCHTLISCCSFSSSRTCGTRVSSYTLDTLISCCSFSSSRTCGTHVSCYTLDTLISCCSFGSSRTCGTRVSCYTLDTLISCGSFSSSWTRRTGLSSGSCLSSTLISCCSRYTPVGSPVAPWLQLHLSVHTLISLLFL